MKPQLAALAMAFSLLGFTLNAEPLAVGAPAPAVTATTDSGEILDLAAVYRQGTVLIYFYPKADTPGCTAQSCSLRDAFEDLTDRNIIVIGVSTDSVAAQRAFKEKHNLPFTLLADTERKVIEAFGVPTRMGFAARQAFLIREGKVVWRDTSASTREQANDVLAALAQLDGESSS